MASYTYDDPDAGRLLAPPATTKRKRHQVRIQGRLVLVRSVSAVHLAAPVVTPTSTDIPHLPTAGRTSPPTRHDPGVGQVVNSSKQQQHRRQRRQSTVPTARRKSYGSRGDTADLFFEDGMMHDGAVDTTASETEEDEQETALRDRQRRGYGIGGAGNIRRPTEVIQFYSSSRTGTGSDDRGRRRRWQWMSSLFGLRGRKDGGGGDAGAGIDRVEDGTVREKTS